MSLWGEGLRLVGWESTIPREGVGWWARNPDRSFEAIIPGAGDAEPFRGAFGAAEFQRWHLPPLWSLRLTSLLLSVVLLLAAVSFAEKATGSERLALCVGVLLAVSPAVARWDTVVRYLSPVSLPVLGMAAALWGIACARSLRVRWWLLPALTGVTALALLMHHIAAFFAPPLGVWLLLVCGRARWRRTVAAGAAMFGGLGIFLLVWGSGLREQWAGSGLITPSTRPRMDWLNLFPLQPALPHRVLLGLDGQTGVFDLFPAWWIWGLLVVLFVCTVGYLLRLTGWSVDSPAQRAGRLDGLILLWLFGPPALVVAVNLWRPNTGGMAWRQYMAAAPAAALLFALGLEWIVNRAQGIRRAER
jgi:hypothetical protein